MSTVIVPAPIAVEKSFFGRKGRLRVNLELRLEVEATLRNSENERRERSINMALREELVQTEHTITGIEVRPGSAEIQFCFKPRVEIACSSEGARGR